MKTETAISILEKTIGNPLTRSVLRPMSKFCKKDGKNSIEVAVELYVGKREKACFSCRLAEKMIRKVIKKGGEAFGVSEKEIKEKFSHSYWAKALASTVRGIAIFGVRRPFTAGAPFQVVWDVTKACNLKCKHCYSASGKKGEDEMDTEQAKRAIDILANAGVTILAFSGGEPLVRKDIFELAKYASDKGMYVAMATNATLITKEVARKMKESGISFVQISLDGSTEEIHDDFRGVKGAFKKTVEGIKNCVEEGFFVEVSTTATHFNYKQIPDIIDLCEKLHVNWFMVFNFIPTGRGQFIFENDLTPEEREELLKMLWERGKNSSIEILSTAPQFARIALEQESKEEIVMPTHFYNPKLKGKLVNLAEFIGGCGAGRFYLAMEANGDLQPCVFFPLKIGNIFEDDFEKLWIKNKVLEDLRNKDKIEKCRKCDYRYYCGGCRARAYAYFKNYLKPDPGCINNRQEYEEAIRRFTHM
ncbi:MAG: radical SAM protein [Thermoplasmatales archaeon]|nr:radical SAM protein [Thermoplasmatales archaeon]